MFPALVVLLFEGLQSSLRHYRRWDIGGRSCFHLSLAADFQRASGLIDCSFVSLQVVAVDDACKALGPDELMDFNHHGDHVVVNLNDMSGVLDQAQIILQRVRERARLQTRRSRYVFSIR